MFIAIDNTDDFIASSPGSLGYNAHSFNENGIKR